MLSSYGFADNLLDHRANLSVNIEPENGGIHAVSVSRKVEQRQRREQLKLGEDLAAYELCLECVLTNRTGEGFYKTFADGSVSALLQKRPIWLSDMPSGCTPAGGRLPSSRLGRKIHQVNNMVLPARALIEGLLESWNRERRLRVVEFCAGSGFVLLPLAQLFPRVEFVLIDYKQRSIDIARERIESANNLRDNVRVILGRIEDYEEDFELGLGLHACGPLSDITLSKCYAKRASFVIAPCCVGKINLGMTVSLPRSKRMQESVQGGVNGKPHGDNKRPNCGGRGNKGSWPALLKAADFGHSSHAHFSATTNSNDIRDDDCGDDGDDSGDRRSERRSRWRKNRLRRVCKSVVEEDRRCEAEERGYAAHLLLMQPSTASPKNDILVGWPLEVQEMRNGGAPLLRLVSAHASGEGIEAFLSRVLFDEPVTVG